MSCFDTDTFLLPIVSTVQKLELQRNIADEGDTVRGQIVVSLISRDRGGAGPPVFTDITTIPQDPNDLPEGWVIATGLAKSSQHDFFKFKSQFIV